MIDTSRVFRFLMKLERVGDCFAAENISNQKHVRSTENDKNRKDGHSTVELYRLSKLAYACTEIQNRIFSIMLKPHLVNFYNFLRCFGNLLDLEQF